MKIFISASFVAVVLMSAPLSSFSQTEAGQKAAADLAQAEARMGASVEALVKLRPSLKGPMREDDALWRTRTMGLCREMAGNAAPGSVEARIGVTDCWTTYANMRIDWIEKAAAKIRADEQNAPLRVASQPVMSVEAPKVMPPVSAVDKPQLPQDTAHTAFSAADKSLNEAYQAAMARLDPGAKTALRNQQRAWIKTRDLSCGPDVSGGIGPGSVGALDAMSCQTEMTKKRTIEIRKLS